MPWRHTRFSNPVVCADSFRTLAFGCKEAYQLSLARRLEWTVGVAQRLAAAVVATFVTTIAPTEACVTRAVGSGRRLGGRQGRVSGRCDGYLVLVELQ